MLRVPIYTAWRQLGNVGTARLCTVAPTASAQQPLPSFVMPSEEHRIKYYPRIGNREFIAFGLSGMPSYIDDEDIPCPSVRFKSNTPRFLELREMEKGHWGDMSLEDKKESYRNSYCQTFSEFKTGQKGRWKLDLTWTIVWLGITVIGLVWSDMIFRAPPAEISDEGHLALLERMIVERSNIASLGIASEYDYEKGEWKK